MWLYHLFCSDSEGCSAIYGLTSQSPLFQQQFTHHESWKEEDLTFNQLLLGTCFSTVRYFLEVDSFSAGFTPQSWFFINYFCPKVERSLKLIWIVYVIRNFSFTLQRLWCTQLQLDSNTLVFPKQDMQWTRKIFSASRLRQTLCFFFPSRGERPDVCQEKITCLYVQLFYSSRTDLFFLHVCHNQQVNLLWTEIWSAGGGEHQIESLPLAQGVSFSCVHLK